MGSVRHASAAPHCTCRCEQTGPCPRRRRHFCEELRVEPATIERVQAAVTEACSNCIQHAYSGDSEADTFTIDATTADGELVICVSDCGRGIDDVEERRLDGGFGLEIIEGLADAYEIRQLDRGGTCVVLRSSCSDA